MCFPKKKRGAAAGCRPPSHLRRLAGLIGARSCRCQLGLLARVLELLVPALFAEICVRILIFVPIGSDTIFSRCVTSLSSSARVAHSLPTLDLVDFPHFPVAEGHAQRVRAVPFAVVSARFSEAGKLCRRENSPASVDRLSVVALLPPPRRRRPRWRSSIKLARRHRPVSLQLAQWWRMFSLHVRRLGRTMPSPYLKKMRHHQHDLGVTSWAEDVPFDLDCDSRRLFSPASTPNAPAIPTSSASYTT